LRALEEGDGYDRVESTKELEPPESVVPAAGRFSGDPLVALGRLTRASRSTWSSALAA
jgi:hypothetical protein